MSLLAQGQCEKKQQQKTKEGTITLHSQGTRTGNQHQTISDELYLIALMFPECVYFMTPNLPDCMIIITLCRQPIYFKHGLIHDTHQEDAGELIT